MTLMIVGERIQVNDDIATIRYIGPVEGTKGEWLGVEWDDGSRGKHDGTHQGKRYFVTRYKHRDEGRLQGRRWCSLALKRTYSWLVHQESPNQGQTRTNIYGSAQGKVPEFGRRYYSWGI